MAKTTVIHHSADFDGIFCREIARKFLPDAELIGWDYGNPKIPVPIEGTIYILDLSPECLDAPYGQLLPSILERTIWIDHHKSAINKYQGEPWIHEPAGKDSFGTHYNEFWRRGHETRATEAPPSLLIKGYRIDGVAACRLAWFYFTAMERYKSQTATADFTWFQGHYPWASKQDFIDRKVSEPWAIRLAGEYDIWDKRDPDAELLQHGLRSQELTESDWKKLLCADSFCGCEKLTEQLLTQGRALQYARTEENASIIKDLGFTFQWEGLTWLACNHARYNSHLFTVALKPEHDACFGFKFTGHVAGKKPNEEWSVSLYHAPGKEHHDLSQIAVKHGGGGHRGACGFRISKLPFLE